ncbi:hypothetical protein BO79DRAFT_258000 [Aspergillus costaricaensis CBS 115574]|uniref:Uncharacterized protein n=1 Tax=Aspergillus costaricaensis CBS 115574 TaxID=1448317 RepID=A0ACD1I5S8_9EURO|nr:hypothetical protein BO79DRAFT_258000 [Aspergillus costaricaensis CBS 115574]RAK85854.1 hypothetical protein BO79DRAFT_258000 [Aspergillus costaricaensis CBS 115574]
MTKPRIQEHVGSPDDELRNKSMINPAYLAAAGMQSCSGVAIPMTPTNGKADRTTMSTEGVDVNEYQSLRRMHAPTRADAKALKVVYRYGPRADPLAGSDGGVLKRVLALASYQTHDI